MERNLHVHLVITEKCNHDCKLCCNKQYRPEDTPVVSEEELSRTDILFFTGGEPFYVEKINTLAKAFKEVCGIPNIVVYTSGEILRRYLERGGSLSFIDGLNICPKTTDEFYDVREILLNSNGNGISALKMNRLYLFPKFYKMYQKGLLPVPENFKVHRRTWQREFEPGGGIFRRIQSKTQSLL